MKQPEIITLDEYVCEHWGLTPEQIRGIDICDFNRGDRELPPDNSGKQAIAYGDGSFGVCLKKDDPLAKALGIDPDRGPIVYFDTMPLDPYLTRITPTWMREQLALRRGRAVEIGYAVNIFVPKKILTEDGFDNFCGALKEKLPDGMKLDETSRTGNDEVFYGRAGSEGSDFRFRDLASSVVEFEQSQTPNGRIKQYTAGFGGRYRLGWIYPNQIQICWNGDAVSTVGLVKSVADLVKERGYEAHFDLPIDHNGLMRTRFGITGAFYKPKEGGS